MWNDIRYAVRLMHRNPVFTATIVLTVMLAIGANTAIFSVVYSVLLRPLPYAESNRVVQVAEKNDKLNIPNFGASVLNFVSWREQSNTFEALAAVGSANYTLTGNSEPEQLSGNRISPALTKVLGIAPIVGRGFTEDEEKPGNTPVALLGEGLWRRRFGADRNIVGQTIQLNGAATTIVGVLPASVNLLSGGEIYTPLTIDPAKEIRLNHVIGVFGRLKPGVTLAQAQSEMDAISSRLGVQYPEIRDWGIRLISLFDTFVSPQLKTALVMLLFAVGFVLLIACANIANLLLARAANRQREMVARTALGASRPRLIRQLLVESAVISIGGGIAGFLAGLGGVRLLNHALPPNTLPVPVEIDNVVFAFAAGLTLLTGVIFGIGPAWRIASVDINEVLKASGRGSSGGLRAKMRNGLIAGEVALATVLLIGAALLLQSLSKLERVRLGFDSQHLLTFQLAPPVAKYPLAGKAPLLYRSVIDSLQSLPGVTGAAVSSGIPFGAGNYTTHPVLTTGASALPPDTLVPIDWRIVSPGYFKTMDIPLLRGRDFTDADGPNPNPVIVSQATAKKFWGDANPIGRALIRSADRKTAFTVVGVVGDVRSTALNQESPALYYPMAWRVWPVMDIVVRTSMPPDQALPAVRQRIHDIDSGLALANVRTMDDWLASSAAQPRLNTVLLTLFAAIALLIATVGIYGVLAYSVTQRTREIGVRMALGASPQGVLRLILGEGMAVAGAGIVLGLIGGLAVGRAISTLVFGVAVRDPLTFATVSAVLAIVALLACLVPARRAAMVEPMEALRFE